MPSDALTPSPEELLQIEVPAIHVRLLVRDDTGAGNALLASALLEGTGLDLEDLKTATHLTLGQQLRILHNYAAATDDPEWALKFGSRISLNTLGPLGIGAVSAPTLGEGIDVLNRYLAIRTPFIANELFTVGEFTHSRYTPTIALGALEPAVMELVFQVAQTYLETFTESPISAATLRLRYARPAHGDSYHKWFHCRFEFDADCNELVIPAPWNDLVSPLYDAPLWQTSLAECEALLTSREAGDTTRHQVKRLIMAALDNQPNGDQCARIPSAAEVAEQLHITSRTLIRRLKRSQTSYQALRDEVIKQRVDYLLTETRLPIADIGARVGYSDPANFGRVCRRWFGKSPGSLRDTIRQPPADSDRH